MGPLSLLWCPTAWLEIDRHVPDLVENSDQVLRSLGYASVDMATLRSQGVDAKRSSRQMAGYPTSGNVRGSPGIQRRRNMKQ